jgi:predicted DNA-binding WGR domain protein
MQKEKTYLELSEEAGGSHKFYEAVVSGDQLTIRYGRIGDAGQTQTKAFADAAKALAEANKKINEKLKKGYERAVPGVRQKRTVTMYDWVDGTQLWERQTPAQVLFGWQEESMVYACTAAGRVHSFTKAGVDGAVYECDAALFSCATAEDGKYVFAGDNNGALYCFNEAGERLWKLSSGCGAAYSMQFMDERLYIVTTQGTLACIDASEAAIAAAQTGVVPEAVTIKVPVVEAIPATAMGTTREAGVGVVVECYQEGSRLRVRVVSEGFDPSWHCQFPKGIREAGARYVVDEVRESRNGFYRAFGNIKKLGE